MGNPSPMTSSPAAETCSSIVDDCINTVRLIESRLDKLVPPPDGQKAEQTASEDSWPLTQALLLLRRGLGCLDSKVYQVADICGGSLI